MKWRIAILGLAGVVLLAGSSLAGLAFWILRTEGGAQWILAQIDDRAGPSLSFGAVSGTLTDRITIADIEVSLPDGVVSIDRLTIRPNLSDLFARRVVFEELAAGTVSYVQRGGVERERDSSGDAGFTSPFAVDLRQANIDSIQVTTPDFAGSFTATSLAGGLEGGTIRVIGLSTTTRNITVSGDAELDVSGAVSGTGELAWSTDIDGTPWSGAGRVTVSVAGASFTHRLDAPFPATVDGELTFGDTLDATVSAEWVDLYWPGESRVSSPNGSLQLSGWIESFDFSGAGRLLVEGEPVDFVTSGEAVDQMFRFGSLELQTDFGAADISGAVSLLERSVDLQFTARDLDSGAFFAEWPTLVNASGRLEGTLEPTLSWSLNELVLDGSVRGETVGARGNVSSPAAGEWRLDTIEVEWGGNRANLSGSIGEVLDVAFRIDAPELEAFPGGIAGRASLDGTVTGTRALPAFSGALEAESLGAGDFSLDRLRIDGQVAAAQEAQVDVTFAADGFRREQVIVSSMSGRLEGTTASHVLAVDLAHRVGAGSIRGSGSWTGTQWQGELASVELNQDLLGVWSLEAPTHITASREALVVDTGCLRNAAARFCGGTEIGTEAERVAVSIESFDLASLQPLLGEAVSISGLYDGELELFGPRDRPTGTLNIVGRSTLLSVSDVEAPLDIPVDVIEIDARLTATELEATAGLRAPAGASVDLAGTVSGIWTPEPMVSASIDGTWTDLEFISILSPEVGDVSGVATVAVAIEGPLDAPVARGEARWAEGQLEVPRWGLVIRDIDALVSSPAGNELAYSFTGSAGEGGLQLTGRTLLDPETSWPTSLRISGENVAAIQLPEAQVVVSPELEVMTDWPTVFVNGTVTIPSASLSLDQVAAQSATVSPDVVVHGVEASSVQRPLDVRADLQIILGDDVRFRGSGLNAELSGGIGIDYRSGQDAVASGTVMLAGDYTTLGQTLELDQGRLLFTGPVTNPGLDVRGVRRFETLEGEVLAGVIVTGTVREPVTRLFSEPSMSEGDIVSYLVIGRPISDSSRENSEALQTAALSLGLTQALPQIQHFGEAIGLDELGIRTSQANTGELMAGKQISPRIYMRYTYGLINRIGGLLLRFKLTDQLRLETRTGEFKAMDLLYTIERE